MNLGRSFNAFGPGRRYFVSRRGLYLEDGGDWSAFNPETATFLTRGAASTIARHYGGEVMSAIVQKTGDPGVQ